MKRTFNVLVEQDEDGIFVSEVMGLPGCHTQGDTIDELMKNTSEAITLYTKSTRKLSPEKFVGLFQLAV